jgi:hypothetical protein
MFTRLALMAEYKQPRLIWITAYWKGQAVALYEIVMIYDVLEFGVILLPAGFLIINLAFCCLRL